MYLMFFVNLLKTKYTIDFVFFSCVPYCTYWHNTIVLCGVYLLLSWNKFTIALFHLKFIAFRYATFLFFILVPGVNVTENDHWFYLYLNETQISRPKSVWTKKWILGQIKTCPFLLINYGPSGADPVCFTTAISILMCYCVPSVLKTVRYPSDEPLHFVNTLIFSWLRKNTFFVMSFRPNFCLVIIFMS